ncbi:MAG: peptide ABC transporter substrate-binding protein [Gemmatimonadaceae bacterium]
MMRRLLLASTAALIAVGGACSRPARSGDTVVYASGADLESANPLVTIHALSRQLQRYALFVTLARYDSALVARPYAAREWRWSADRRMLTLTLASGLRWHDGVPTTAADVVFTLEAARDPVTGYSRYADLQGISDVAAEGDSVVTIRFVREQPRFPLVLCELPIVPAHLLAATARSAMRQAPFSTAPVGNGPFRFIERRAKQRWVFERNPDFPRALGGPPRLSRLVIAVVDEATTKFAGLVGGELDVAGISPTMASLVARDPSLRVLEYPVLVTTGLVFNTAKPPFDDVRVRRAISLSLVRPRVISVALAGYATPAAGPVPPGHPYSVPQPVTLDTALADSLLDAAGWRRAVGGRRAKADRAFTLELLTVGSGDNATEQLVQSDLAARGIRVEIRQRELGAFLAEARAERRTFDALITGVPGDLSLAYLSAMDDSRLAGGALDYGGYHSARLDSLLDRARAAPSDSRARVAWADVQRELAAQAPAAWIFHSRGVQGVTRRLRGVTMDVRGEMVTLAGWSLDAMPRTLARAP